MPGQNKRSAYERFLLLLGAQSAQPVMQSLDPLERRILTIVGLATQRADRLSVCDLLGHYEVAAPATIQGRINSMRLKGWIMLQETSDSRRKQVALTPAALSYLDKVAELMLEALQGREDETQQASPSRQVST